MRTLSRAAPADAFSTTGFRGGFAIVIVCEVEKDGESVYINRSGACLTGAYTGYYYACKEDTWLAFHSDEEHPFNFAVRSNA